MAFSLKNNAYHVLGLDTTSSERDISKRSKEIINRLKAGDSPEYDMDIGLFKDFRTEDSVRDALQRLQSPKKRIIENFFWFQISSGIDEQVLGLFKLKDHLNAIRIWKNASEGQGTKAFFYKKNLAILYALVLSSDEDKYYLQDSLALWKELIESNKFWSSFTKVYKLHDEQTASAAIISDFEKHVVEYLSDIYTELHQVHHNSDYINEFQKVFSVKGEKIEKKVLGPAYHAINEAIDKLGALKVSDDGVLDNEEKGLIKEQVDLIKSELNKLIDLGLYDDTQTVVLRDRAANILRSLSIDLHNNLDELEVALGVAKIAEQISGMQSSKSKIQADVATLQGNLDSKKNEEKINRVIEPLIKKIKSGESDKALQEINHLLYNTEPDPELKKILLELKQTMEERIVKHGKPIRKAPTMASINGIGTRIYGDTLYFCFVFIPIIPLARYSLEDHGGGSYNFLGKLELHNWQKYWKYIMIAVISILFLIIISGG